MKRWMIYTLWAVMMTYYGAYVTISNMNSTKGLELAGIQEEIKALKAENALLKAKILKESSLTTIDKKAREQGFTEAFPNNILYLYDN